MTYPPYKPDEYKVALEAARVEQEALPKLTVGNTYGNQHFSLVRQDGQVHRYFGQGCFAPLHTKAEKGFNGYREDLNGQKVETRNTLPHYVPYLVFWGLATAPSNYKTPIEDEAGPYIDYLVNHSVFKDVFVTKDPKEILSKGTIMSGHMPLRFLMMAGMSLRSVFEGYQIVRAFKQLSGCAPIEAAFMFSHFLYYANKQLALNPGGATHHWVDSGDIGKDHYTRFVNRDFSVAVEGKQAPFYQKTADYSGIASFWGGEAVKGFVKNPLVFPTHLFKTSSGQWHSYDYLEEANFSKAVEEFHKVNYLGA